jgi:hypothetical protein
MSSIQIITIVLVKNEDIYLRRVLKNILDFSDKIIIADNCSEDNTSSIAADFSEIHKKVEYKKISLPSESHDLIKNYAGQNVWIFGVDGDELYDTHRLEYLKRELQQGKYNNFWMVLGNVLNCLELDEQNGRAKGYLAPPCRSMTKLYNFSQIESWEGACTERLHGGVINFKHGFSPGIRKYIYKEIQWDESIFRCLHLCFLVRSSLDKVSNGILMRQNIADMKQRSLFRKMADYLLKYVGKEPVSDLKKDKYMRGVIHEVSTNPFFE